MKTDQELKLALVKMLPEIYWNSIDDCAYWIVGLRHGRVLDTEWLHVCWLVEQTLSGMQMLKYQRILSHICENSTLRATHATWQQRATALC